MKHGGTNDTRIKARLRNEAEVKSRRAKKKEKGKKRKRIAAGGHTAHSIEIQNRRGLSLYKLKRNRATLLSLSLSLSLFAHHTFLHSSFFFFFFSAMEVESRQERGFAEKGRGTREGMIERERERESVREEEFSVREVVKRGLKLRKTFVRKWRSGIETAIFIIENPPAGLWCMK